MEWQEILNKFINDNSGHVCRNPYEELVILRLTVENMLEKLAKDETEKKEKIQANCCHELISKNINSEEWKCDHCDAIIRRI